MEDANNLQLHNVEMLEATPLSISILSGNVIKHCIVKVMLSGYLMSSKMDYSTNTHEFKIENSLNNSIDIDTVDKI